MNAGHLELHIWRFLLASWLFFDVRSLIQRVVIVPHLIHVVAIWVIRNSCRYKWNDQEENGVSVHLWSLEQVAHSFYRAWKSLTMSSILVALIFPWTYLLLIWKEKQNNSLFINLWSTKRPPNTPFVFFYSFMQSIARWCIRAEKELAASAVIGWFLTCKHAERAWDDSCRGQLQPFQRPKNQKLFFLFLFRFNDFTFVE